MKQIIERVLESRALRDNVPNQADSIFIKKLQLPIKVLMACERSVVGDEVKCEARRQFVVSLCSAFEVYWKWVLQDLVNSYEFSPGSLARMKAKEYRIGDIFEILGNSISLGELLSHSYIFNSTETVQRFCIDVFDYDLFSALSKSSFMVVATAPGFTRKCNLDGKAALRCRESVDMCFDIRNLSIHSIANQRIVEAHQLNDYFGEIVKFNTIAYTQIRFDLLPKQSTRNVNGVDTTVYEMPGSVLLHALEAIFGEFEHNNS